MNNNDHLTTKPLPGLIKGIAIPASVGMFFHTMYNVVDTYFGGLISTEALASLSLSFPVFFIIIAMGTGISTGASALISNALGAKNENQAMRYAAQFFLLYSQVVYLAVYQMDLALYFIGFAIEVFSVFIPRYS